jgi:two-component system, OmpR family, aerobic respiration control sensor histidine kinase ArcB
MCKQLKVLLVEDNNLATIAAKMSLNQIGCLVHVVSTGKEAITKAQAYAYDLIFMDIGLGDMDGFDVTKRIRKYSEKNLNTPIIALTAHEDDGSQKRAIGVGMNDFMTKPLTIEAARGVVNKFCHTSYA